MRALNVNAAPFVPAPPETKRCTYCLVRYDATMFSKTQWNAKRSRNRHRRKREPTASDDLKACFAAFDVDGDPFTWRRCKNCWETNKCLRGELGLLKKTALQPSLEFLGDDDDEDGEEGDDDTSPGNEQGRRVAGVGALAGQRQHQEGEQVCAACPSTRFRAVPQPGQQDTAGGVVQGTDVPSQRALQPIQTL